jgi:hypothetical protein
MCARETWAFVPKIRSNNKKIMIVIEDKIISDDVVEKHFICNLDACKGACCWEGDMGAPLEDEELPLLQDLYEDIKPFLAQEGIKAIEAQGVYTFNEAEKIYVTPLIENEACAYLVIEANGVAKCGIEKAYEAGAIAFKKPISCHLYPIRITEYADFSAVNYDKWDICSAACSLGKKHQMPVYQFVKDALIRKYGEEFYEALDAAAQYDENEAYEESE